MDKPLTEKTEEQKDFLIQGSENTDYMVKKKKKTGGFDFNKTVDFCSIKNTMNRVKTDDTEGKAFAVSKLDKALNLWNSQGIPTI